MSHVSIYGKNWIDLVFEGKNKSYGAYQLRQESEQTTLAAFLFTILFLVCISGMGMLLSSFGEKPAVAVPTIDGPVIFRPVTLPKMPTPKKTAVPIAKTTEPDDNKKVLKDPIIVSGTENPDNLTKTETAIVIDEGESESTTGTISTNSATNGTATVTVTPAIIIPDNKPINTAALDKLPEFPGGIAKFYEFVGRNFEKPEVELSQKINVLMYFVIEKDGSMTDVKVLRNPGYGLDKEAIRVLKSLRTKWKPGIKDGNPVRTAYTLPISVQPQ